MRIRTIKPEFFTHEGIFQAEKESKLPLRIAFTGLWCAADRRGRFRWEARRLGVQIMPYDGIDFSRVLDALVTRGFVVKYRVGDACFGVILSFERHQIVNNREKESDLPDIAEGVETEDVDASTTRAPRVPHASKAEGKGREQEGNRNGGVSDAFEEFWNAFGYKVGKPDAIEAWKKHKCDLLLPEILTGIRLAKESDAWKKDGGRFRPHPATWLNRKGWEDDPSTWPTSPAMTSQRCRGMEIPPEDQPPSLDFDALAKKLNLPPEE